MNLRAALLLVLVMAAGCTNAASSAPLGPRVLDSRTADPEVPFEAFDTTKPALFDLDADGDLEIVAHNDNNRVVVLDAVDGRLLAELETRHPGVWNVRELNDIVVTDLDADGRPDVVVANSAGWLTRFEMDALASTPDALAFTKLWEIRVDPRLHDPDYRETHPWIQNGTSPSMDGGPYVADVDRDGVLEIFVQTDGWPGHFSFDADGELRWMSTWSDGNASPWVTDLDGDRRLEAVYVTDGGRVYAYDAEKGYLLWTFRATAHGVSPGSISVSPAFGDLDGDGRQEIVFATRQAVENRTDSTWIETQHTTVFAVSAPPRNAQPTILWNVTYPWLNPHAYTHPAILDVDGDGRLDVLSMDWNTIGHKPGKWETTGPPNLFALDGRDGSVIWHKELESPWNNKDLAVGDADGDGDQEIVLADPRHGEPAITFRDLRTGAYEGSVPIDDWGAMRGPQLADVDGDDRLDVVQALSRPATGCVRDLDVGCREGAFLVLPLDGSEAAWPGRFTFDRSTETVYAKRSAAERPVVGEVASRRGELSVRVTGEVETVEVSDGVTSRRLRETDGIWRTDAAFPAGARLAVTVEYDGGRLVVPRSVPQAPPLVTFTPAPETTPGSLREPGAPARSEGVARPIAARAFDGSDLAVAAAAVLVLAGLAGVFWILRGSRRSAPALHLRRPGT